MNLTYSDVQCPDAGCGGPQSRPGAPLWWKNHSELERAKKTFAQLKEEMRKRSSEELRSKMKDTSSPHHLTQALHDKVTWKTTQSSSYHFGWNFWSVVGKETTMVVSLSLSPITLRPSCNFADLLLPT